MGLVARVEAAARTLREQRRRVYRGPERLWVELRGAPGRMDALVGEVERSPAVEWARWNGPLGRLVVAHRGDPDAALAAVRQAEAAVGVDHHPFPSEPSRHPADRSRRTRALIKGAANLASIGVGQALRATGARPHSVEIDLAALSAAFENLPPARRWLDQVLGGSRSDLALGLASSLTSALAQGATGQLVDLVYRGLRLAEIHAAREAWDQREAELSSRPEDHPPQPPRTEPRPTPLPKGPIERYSEPAGMASLGGFGFGVATTGRAEKAAASIFGTVPRPARVGREAFGATLGRSLARRGFVVVDDRTLRRMDRVDRVVLPHDLVAARYGEIAAVWPRGTLSADGLLLAAHRVFDPEDPDHERVDGPLRLSIASGPLPTGVQAWRAERSNRAVATLRQGRKILGHIGVARIVAPPIRAMVAHLRANGLSLAVISGDPDAVRWCDPERVVDPRDLRAEIRRMQRHGHGVLLVTTGPHEAAPAADLTLGLPRAGEPPPWGAHLIAPRREDPADPEDVVLLIDAIEAARRASRQSVGIAGADAAAGLVLSLEGQKIHVLRRIMNVSGLATLGAIGNGARIARQVVPRPVAGDHRTPWHALEPREVLHRLGSAREGLGTDEAERRVEAPPRAPTEAEEFARAVWREVAGPFGPILATGAGLSAVAGSPVDAGLIGATVAASGLVSGWQQVAAAKAMRQLEQARPTPVRAWRDGQLVELVAGDLVPGDVITLEAGDRVPADCRILEAHRLETDESSLTGESVPIRKGVEPSFAGVLAERSSMLYADTTVAAGEAVAVVVAVGAATESRRGLLGLRPPESAGVQSRLEQLTRVTGPIAGLAAVGIVAMGLVRNRPAQELVDTAVSLAVAAVPETLPLLATAAQLAAARRLSARGALVRNVAAVEALGRVDVLCADKTGTLTEGILRLRVVGTADRDAELDQLDDELRDVLRLALHASPAGGPVPHPTDRALIEGAEAARVVVEGWERLAELPFEPARGYHATAVQGADCKLLCLKGAPEVVIPLCTGDREALLARAVALAERGLRVLAVAERAKAHDTLEADEIRDLTFRGFVGIADPVRPSARDAIRRLRQAGVEVMMITGDHPATARAIADELGLEPEVLTGPALERMTEEELGAALPRVRVFARATPQHKVRIVTALQRAGRVVAMTGDGANDAPAIRLANVGVALGERATAAARGAADLLVTDERIETLVDAVLEGRAMWASVRDAVSTLVGGNIGELTFTLLGGLVEGRAPLGPRQLMLVNLLTDALPALMIAVRPPGHTTPERLLGEGPERSLGSALDRDMAWRAAATAGATTLAWVTARPLRARERAGTIALLTLVGTQLGQTLWLGWRNPPVVAAALGSGAVLLGVVQVPGLSRLAGSTPLGPAGLAHAALFTAAGVLGAGLVPSAWRWADHRVALEQRIAALGDSEVGRLVLESRVVVRLIEEITREPVPADDESSEPAA